MAAQSENIMETHEICINKTNETSFKMKVASRDMIKPSRPTPNDKKTVQFSLFDQISPNFYVSLILFYENDVVINSIDSTERSLYLKKSLSETLVDFYPLAGRIKQNELIECNDEGAEFCEAHLYENLMQYVENPSIEDLVALLPFHGKPRHENIVLSVQVNYFNCGGMAIAVCFSHKFVDGASMVHFLQAWAERNVGRRSHIDNMWRPNFNGASLFPPHKELNEMPVPKGGALQESIAVRRLIFDKKTIDELKAEAAKAMIEDTTRMEVATAFIWKHLPQKFFTFGQVLNLRKRMAPLPIPDHFFGNCITITRFSPTTTTNGDRNKSPKVFIEEFRKAVDKMSQKYISEVFSNDSFLVTHKQCKNAIFDRPNESILCNSWSGFPLYDLNFGMGKPFWVSIAGVGIKNGVQVMSTKCGGIEAWISMLEDDIAHLDTSLSQLASPMLKSVRIK